MNDPNDSTEPSSRIALADRGATVVVGYDGSAQAGAALEWAAAEAWRRRTRLLVSTVCDTARAAGTPAEDPWPSTEMAAAKQLAEQGAARAATAFPQLETSVSAPFQHPAEALIEQSRGTAMLVVGASGHGQLGATVFGSVALAAITHASCPVIVVRGDSGRQPGPQAPVVLGVDGSDSCRQATAFAARTAADRDAPLILVFAWQSVRTDAFAAQYWARAEPTLPPDQAAAAQARTVLDQAAAQVRGAHPDLAVRTRAVQGPTVQVLGEAAGDAALVVVGARGRGGFAGLLLGSVSRRLTLTAPCPVAVVRGTPA
jgi:nucleotide-binding universal stress UspA family protein